MALAACYRGAPGVGRGVGHVGAACGAAGPSISSQAGSSFAAPASSACRAAAGRSLASAAAATPLRTSARGLRQGTTFAQAVALLTLAGRRAAAGSSLGSGLRKGSGRGRQTASIARAAGERPYRVLVPVADDSEEIETACITDVLVRAGAEVTVASVSSQLQVKMSRGLKVVADKLIGECTGEQWDVIACPGGMPGAEHLRDSKELAELLKEQRTGGRIMAAVCASPAVVFKTHGLLGESATSYPAPKFKEMVGSGWTDAKAVVDGNIITSQGPGTSLQFALKIVEVLYGRAKAEELAAQMVTEVA